MTVVAERSAYDAHEAVGARNQLASSIYQRYHAALRRYFASKLNNEADAEDFAQEVYLRFSRMQHMPMIRSERAFIFTTATNLLRDRSRRVATQVESLLVCAEDVTLECRSYDPVCRLQDAEHLSSLFDAIDNLGESCRTAFWLSRIQGLGYKEIAATMGVSVSMVEKHISAALARLRQCMTPETTDA